jgi:8-oxo-dGTP pyrophosphatase MutT (NUDIX family)
MEQIIDRVKERILNNELPGLASHIKMVPPDRDLDILPEDFHRVRQSAVLFILHPNEKGELSTYFIQRPSTMRSHAGQIGFPGGKFELSDPSFEYTAIRECKEEIGIQPGLVQVIGRLTSLYIPVSHFLIHPVVATLKAEPSIELSKDEVADFFQIPIAEFLKPESRSTKQIETVTGSLEVPCFKIDNRIIWGATAMIISEFIDLIN